MMNTAKRTKRLETRRKPKMTNEQLLAFLSAGVGLDSKVLYQLGDNTISK